MQQSASGAQLQPTIASRVERKQLLTHLTASAPLRRDTHADGLRTLPTLPKNTTQQSGGYHLGYERLETALIATQQFFAFTASTTII